MYLVRCRSAGQIGGADRRENLKKIGVQHGGKNLFCALFLIFSKNFYALKTPVFACFRLFCELLTRACVFIIFEKNGSKNIFQKPVDIRCTRCYTVYTVKERYFTGRLDRDGVHRIGRGARPI